MNLIRPHVFALVAAVRAPLQLPRTLLNTMVPMGANFRLDYILVTYPRTVVAGAQTSPELTFTLKNTRGIEHNNPALTFSFITNPAGGPALRAAWAWGIEFPPGAIITMEVSGMNAGPVPATISVTYLSQKGWGRR